MVRSATIEERKQFEGKYNFQVIVQLFGTLQRKGPHFIDEMNGILDLLFVVWTR
jgi:hypothetical protein